MNYQVIARKYRPQRFADVVGQEHVTQTLANAIRQNRIAHAYLFCGPRGTGKTTIARIFAKCLNCTGGPKVDFDPQDSRCQEIADGRAIDVLEIDGASNNGVEQVRELRETAKYSPASSRFKVYIIDEVHMLSTAAFNALLKTLEEPPAHVKFMFATTDPEKVLPTILSRCQRFDLRRIPAALIVKHLAQIAQLEGVQIDEAALFAVARGADGGMRDAESTLDQLISFCGSEIVETDVLSMFGLAARGQILGLAGAVLGGETATALRSLDELARNGKDLGRLLSDLLHYFRNLLIYQVSRGDLRLLEVSEAEVTALKDQAATVGTEALTRIMEVLAESEGRLRDAVSKKILIEVALLRAIQVRGAVSLDTVLKELNRLRQQEPGLVAAVAATPSVTAKPGDVRVERDIPVAQPITETQGARATPPPTLLPPEEAVVLAEPAPIATPGAQLPALWGNLLEAVGRASPFTRSYLLKAFPVSLDNRLLTIGFDPEFADYIPLVDNAKNHALLQTKLKELGVAEGRVRFVQAEAPAQAEGVSLPAAPPPSPSVPPPPAGVSAATRPADTKTPRARAAKQESVDFKNDPLIRQALEIFRGEIVEARG